MKLIENFFLEGESLTSSISGRCGPFSQDFEQVLSQIIMYFAKLVTVCFTILCSMAFLVL